MKYVLIAVLLTMVACSQSEPKVEYPSSLDGRDNSASSWHSGHVTVIDSEDFRLDDGDIIHLYFTGGSKPWHLVEGITGVLYVSVPSYYAGMRDDDNTYYFQKFVPDEPERSK
jgi:hypothetical protein